MMPTVRWQSDSDSRWSRENVSRDVFISSAPTIIPSIQSAPRNDLQQGVILTTIHPLTYSFHPSLSLSHTHTHTPHLTVNDLKMMRVDLWKAGKSAGGTDEKKDNKLQRNCDSLIRKMWKQRGGGAASNQAARRSQGQQLQLLDISDWRTRRWRRGDQLSTCCCCSTHTGPRCFSLDI